VAGLVAATTIFQRFTFTFGVAGEGPATTLVCDSTRSKPILRS